MRSSVGCLTSRLLSIAIVVSACGDDQGAIPDEPFDTDSVGADGMSTGDAEGEGVDETGGGPTASDHCLIDPVDELYAYKYQCEGSVIIDITMEGLPGGSPMSDSIELQFGHGVEGDSYEQPHVMACCPVYDLMTPGCEQDHARACVIDVVDQGCKSMFVSLSDYAYDTFPGLENTLSRNAVLRAAEHVRQHQADCTTAFWDETGIASTLPACDMKGNDAVEFDSLLETGEWSFDPGGEIDLVTITVQAADWTSLYPLDGSPEICWSADENDGVLFLEVDPAPESMRLRLAAGSATLEGPSIHGLGELSSTSSLALLTDSASGSASMEAFELHSAGMAVIATGGEPVAIEQFHVRLWDRTPASTDASGTILTVAPGAGRFVVSATALGNTGVVTATNATPLVITNDGTGWSMSGFSIVHQHASEPWALVLMPGRWQED